MLFSSISFLYLFLPITVIVYYLLGGAFEKIVSRKAGTFVRNLVLLLASLVFYAWGEPRYVLIMAAEILAGYLFGIAIEKWRDKALGMWFLGASVVVDLGFLCYFKYVDFFIDNFRKITGLDVKLLGVALPIGISFYTFQILSYTIDVYRGEVKAQKNPITLAAYVAMFQQLIAGPIVRYIDIEKQLTERQHSFEKASAGVRRFVIGLSKKVLIANALGELCNLFRESSDLSVGFYWLYAVAFTLHIYFDFSGYSDMAIGLGKVFGLELLENFDYPYISKSITEFWRRWHMSLGSWFRDYVYIPLGGNRVSKGKWLRNILIVWFLTGFWHGAAWNFIVWGLFYGILLLIEKGIGSRKEKKDVNILLHLYVLLAVIIGFVIFNAADMSQALSDIGGMIGISGAGRLPLISSECLYYLRSYVVIFLLAIVGATPLPKILVQKADKKAAVHQLLCVLEPVALLVLTILVTAYLVDGSFNPFLYFRF